MKKEIIIGIVFFIAIISFVIAQPAEPYSSNDWKSMDWVKFDPTKVTDTDATTYWNIIPPAQKETYMKYRLNTPATMSLIYNPDANVKFTPSSGEIVVDFPGKPQDKLKITDLPSGADISYDQTLGKIVVKVPSGTGDSFLSSSMGTLSVKSLGNNQYNVNGRNVNLYSNTIVSVKSAGKFEVSGSFATGETSITPSNNNFRYSVEFEDSIVDGKSVTRSFVRLNEQTGSLKIVSKNNLGKSIDFTLNSGSAEITSGRNPVMAKGPAGTEFPTSFEFSSPRVKKAKFSVEHQTELGLSGTYCTDLNINCVADLDKTSAKETFNVDNVNVNVNGERTSSEIPLEVSLAINRDSDVLSIVSKGSRIKATLEDPKFDYIWTDARDDDDKIELVQQFYSENEEGVNLMDSYSYTVITAGSASIKGSKENSLGHLTGNTLLIPSPDFDPNEPDKNIYKLDFSKGGTLEDTDMDVASIIGPAFDLTVKAVGASGGIDNPDAVKIYEADDKTAFEILTNQIANAQTSEDLPLMRCGEEGYSAFCNIQDEEMKKQIAEQYYYKFLELNPTLVNFADNNVDNQYVASPAMFAALKTSSSDVEDFFQAALESGNLDDPAMKELFLSYYENQLAESDRSYEESGRAGPMYASEQKLYEAYLAYGNTDAANELSNQRFNEVSENPSFDGWMQVAQLSSTSRVADTSENALDNAYSFVESSGSVDDVFLFMGELNANYPDYYVQYSDGLIDIIEQSGEYDAEYIQYLRDNAEIQKEEIASNNP